MKNIKSLGQNWLKDRYILEEIAGYADISKNDNIIEIGPGLGTLTSVLLKEAGLVVSIEYDAELAKKLPKQFPGKNLTVINDDFLNFEADDKRLPSKYKVVANIPYYITGKIINKILSFKNQPDIIVLLVQKEVAQRIVAVDNKQSVLSISTQILSNVKVGEIIKAEFFTPVPKVDSQILILEPKKIPLIPLERQAKFLRIVKAGFSEKRKKVKTSLAHGLSLSKEKVNAILVELEINPDSRAEDLSIEDWNKIELAISNYDKKRPTKNI